MKTTRKPQTKARKVTRRKIATLDGLLSAIKQKLGPEASVYVSQSIREEYRYGYCSQYVYWSCSAKVTDREGFRLNAEVYCCDTPNQALDKLMVQLAVEARKARADAASARALENKAKPKLAEARKPLLLGYNGK